MSTPKEAINIETIKGTRPLPEEPKSTSSGFGGFGGVGQPGEEEGGFGAPPLPNSEPIGIKKRSPIIDTSLKLTPENLEKMTTKKPVVTAKRKSVELTEPIEEIVAIDSKPPYDYDTAKSVTEKRRGNTSDNEAIAMDVEPVEDASLTVTPVSTPVSAPALEPGSGPGPVPAPITRGGAQQSVDPLTSFLLNMMFIALFYYAATKIFTFYGVGTEVYGLYFTFYLFLYLTTMILPTEYKKIK